MLELHFVAECGLMLNQFLCVCVCVHFRWAVSILIKTITKRHKATPCIDDFIIRLNIKCFFCLNISISFHPPFRLFYFSMYFFYFVCKSEKITIPVCLLCALRTANHKLFCEIYHFALFSFSFFFCFRFSLKTISEIKCSAFNGETKNK